MDHRNRESSGKRGGTPRFITGIGILSFALFMLALMMASSLSSAQKEDQPVVNVVSTRTQARNTRVPCWAPPTMNTCTPTVRATKTPLPTETSTSPPTDTPVSISTPTNTPTQISTNTPVPQTVQPTPTTCRGPDPYWSCQATVAQAELEVARLINLHREIHGAGEWRQLSWNDSLSRAEHGWAIQMVRDNTCFHGDFGQRAIQEGYQGYAWGNIGSCGYPNPEAAVQGWIDSPGHHSIMDEHPDMTEFGVGGARYPNNYWQFWVTIGCGNSIPCGGSLEMSPPAPQLEPILGPGLKE